MWKEVLGVLAGWGVFFGMQSRGLTRSGVGYEAERGDSGTARGRGASDGDAGKQNGKSSKPMGMGGHDE
jgi:hypothetical protein